MEQKEEEKLKAKYPNLSKGGPAMLHKRLIQKGVSGHSHLSLSEPYIHRKFLQVLSSQKKHATQSSVGITLVKIKRESLCPYARNTSSRSGQLRW